MALKNGRCSLMLTTLSTISLAKQGIVFSQSVSTRRYRPWRVIWTLKRQIINDSSRWTLLPSFLRLSYVNLTSTAMVSSSFRTAFVFARGRGGGKLMFLYSVSFPLHDWRRYQHFCGLLACRASQFTSRKGHSTKTPVSKKDSKRIFGNFIKLLS